MDRSLLADAFGHHAWATLRLIDACASLTPAQLANVVPGTYGSIFDTLNHLVASDSWYAFRCSGGEGAPWDDDEQKLGLSELRGAMERNAAVWDGILAGDLDPDAMIVARRDDGSETRAPLGIRLAQAIHHGTDHRSQVCTALTALGMEPPFIDVWDFGRETGRVIEVGPDL